MRRVMRWSVLGGVILALAALLAWMFVKGREEVARERERERPVKMAPRVSRTAEGETVVWLDQETGARVGLGVEPLASGEISAEITAYGSVLDPAPLLELATERLSARAALAASKADYERLAALHEDDVNASRRSVEAAEAQYRTDDNRAALAERRIRASWGDAIAGLSEGDLRETVERMANGATCFVRVDLAPGETVPSRPTAARLETLGDETHMLTTRMVFDAPTVEARLQGRGFLVRIESPGTNLRPGSAVVARLALAGRPRPGALVPRSAVVRFAGRAWLYLEIGEGRFARRELDATHPTDAGWLTSALQPGRRVVIGGAQTLLSEEMKSQIQVLGEGEGKD